MMETMNRKGVGSNSILASIFVQFEDFLRKTGETEVLDELYYTCRVKEVPPLNALQRFSLVLQDVIYQISELSLLLRKEISAKEMGMPFPYASESNGCIDSDGMRVEPIISEYDGSTIQSLVRCAIEDSNYDDPNQYISLTSCFDNQHQEDQSESQSKSVNGTDDGDEQGKSESVSDATIDTAENSLDVDDFRKKKKKKIKDIDSVSATISNVIMNNQKKSSGYNNIIHSPNNNQIYPEDFYFCEYCSFVFPTMQKMKDHDCDRKFKPKALPNEMGNLTQEEILHMQFRKYVCSICFEEYRNYQRVMLHVQKCEKGPYICELCPPETSIPYSTRKLLNSHKIASHKGESSFKCDECKSSFRHKCSLIKHKVKMHDFKRKSYYKNEAKKAAIGSPGDFDTPQTPMSSIGALTPTPGGVVAQVKTPKSAVISLPIASPANIPVQQAIVTNTNPSVSTQPSVPLANPVKMESSKPFSNVVPSSPASSPAFNTMATTPAATQTTFRPEEAKKSPVKTKSLSKIDSSKPNKCDQCPESFIKISNLLKHKTRVHGAGPAYPCQICNIILSTPELLTEHMSEAHGKQGIKKFCCTYCDKVYNQKHNWRAHIERFHTQEKTYPCETCGKTFSRRYKLTEHKQRHTGIKDHHCIAPGCAKSFAAYSDLKNHVKKLHRQQAVEIIKQLVIIRDQKKMELNKKQNEAMNSSTAAASEETQNASTATTVIKVEPSVLDPSVPTQLPVQPLQVPVNVAEATGLQGQGINIINASAINAATAGGLPIANGSNIVTVPYTNAMTYDCTAIAGNPGVANPENKIDLAVWDFLSNANGAATEIPSAQETITFNSVDVSNAVIKQAMPNQNQQVVFVLEPQSIISAAPIAVSDGATWIPNSTVQDVVAEPMEMPFSTNNADFTTNHSDLIKIGSPFSSTSMEANCSDSK